MIRISVLASSSRGNATVISSGDTHVLVDTGISAARIRKGLQECGLAVRDLAGIFYTHDHHDHVCGLGVLAKKDALTLYCSRYMAPDLRALAPSANFVYLEPGARLQIGDFSVTPFAVNHDALDPMGYLFEHKGVRLGYVTDTGKITRVMPELLAGVQGLYLESNYDPDMLQNSGRPYQLIERICGDWGHLSNEQACDFVRTLAHPGLQHVILAHLSPECNTPQKAVTAMQHTLDDLALAQCCLHCAPMAARLPWVELH